MRKLTTSEEMSLYRLCLLQGVELSLGKMTLCNLENHRHSFIKHDRKWQLHCEDKKCPWYFIYNDLEDAVKKFMELKLIITGVTTNVQCSAD